MPWNRSFWMTGHGELCCTATGALTVLFPGNCDGPYSPKLEEAMLLHMGYQNSEYKGYKVVILP